MSTFRDNAHIAHGALHKMAVRLGTDPFRRPPGAQGSGRGKYLYRLWPDAERFSTMPQSVVLTISTWVLALRKTLPRHGAKPLVGARSQAPRCQRPTDRP